MTAWNEADSALYREIASVAVPRRAEQIDTLLALVPFAADESFRAIDLGSGDGRIAAAFLERFPRADLIALDGSASMRNATAVSTARFSARITIRAFDLAALDWWDLMRGADVVLASLSLHHLNDAKKQYLFKAAAERLSARGALLVADLVEPQHQMVRQMFAGTWDAAAGEQAATIDRPELAARFVDAGWNHFRTPDPDDRPSALFHQLVWLRHAGFAAVDCFWMYAGHAIYGGFNPHPPAVPSPA